jgi:hypothetical protein
VTRNGRATVPDGAVGQGVVDRGQCTARTCALLPLNRPEMRTRHGYSTRLGPIVSASTNVFFSWLCNNCYELLTHTPRRARRVVLESSVARSLLSASQASQRIAGAQRSSVLFPDAAFCTRAAERPRLRRARARPRRMRARAVLFPDVLMCVSGARSFWRSRSRHESIARADVAMAYSSPRAQTARGGDAFNSQRADRASRVRCLLFRKWRRPHARRSASVVTITPARPQSLNASIATRLLLHPSLHALLSPSLPRSRSPAVPQSRPSKPHLHPPLAPLFLSPPPPHSVLPGSVAP